MDGDSKEILLKQVTYKLYTLLKNFPFHELVLKKHITLLHIHPTGATFIRQL